MDTCCRTCSRNDNFQGISVDAISENNQEPVYLMLIYCTQLQFSNRDNFPQQICYECMALLDASFSFWKQCRQADSHLQQQLMFGSGSERVPTADTNTPDAAEEQTQIVEQPSQDDEGAFQVEECKVNAQTQVISIDEDVESVSEVETAEPVTTNGEGYVDEGSLLTHQQYIIDSDAESGGEEEQEPEPETVIVPRPTFKIKINRNKKQKLVSTGKLKCSVCKSTFHTSALLYRHVLTHQAKCEHCSKSFSSPRSLARHQELNCPVLKNVTYTDYCKHCNRGFLKSQTLKKHLSMFCPVLHPNGSRNVNQHECKYCSKGFSSNQNVLRHQRENCPVLKRSNYQQKVINIQKQCSYCRKRFNTSKEVKRHVRHCLRRRPLNTSVTPASNGRGRGLDGQDEINSPDYEVHPSELLDCVMKQEPGDE